MSILTIAPRRCRRPVLHTFAPALALLAGAFLSAPAAAQNSVLRGTASSTFAPSIQQVFTNVPVASLAGVIAHDTFGNDGIAKGSISTPAGRFWLSPHACSGGGPGFGGQANAGSNASVTLDYSIVSATLPPGTPVPVFVRWAMTSRVTAVGKDMVGSNTNAQATAGGHVSFGPNYVVTVNRPGGLTRTTSASGDQVIKSGTLNVESDSASYIFNMQVGQVIRVYIAGDLAAASSVEAGQTDADAQLAAVWGVSSLDPAASAVLLGNPAEPAPPAELAIPDSAIALLPPRDIALMPCFQIATQPVDVATCEDGDATFSVGVPGAGPYTYQWRKHGVPIDTETYPSAGTATLTLLGVSAEDAGTYDVVVTDHCGDIVSDGVELTVCVVSVEGIPVARGTQLAPARPAPFRASTRLSFDLAAAGGASLEVFNLRGARVRTLVSGWHEAGHREVTWSGDDDAGHRVPPGVYLVRLRAAGFTGTQRIVKMP